jgi:hypothetical protein
MAADQHIRPGSSYQCSRVMLNGLRIQDDGNVDQFLKQGLSTGVR